MIGFDFVKTKVLKNLNNENNNSFNISLPPVYKLFYDNFYWSEKAVENELFFIPYLIGGEVTLRNLTINELLKTNNDPYLSQRGFINIATSNRGIYLGTKGEFIDKIVSTKNSLDDSLIIIANNIFEFIRGLTDNISEISETSSEYKKYMIDLGYEGKDLDDEIESWLIWKKGRPKKNEFNN